MPLKDKEAQKQYMRLYRKTKMTQAQKKAASDRVQVRKKQVNLENKQKVIEFLQEHSCVDCGEVDIVVLDFDHVRGKKKFSISVGISRSQLSWKTIQLEIEKCEIRCANCHRRKTALRNNNYKTRA